MPLLLSEDTNMMSCNYICPELPGALEADLLKATRVQRDRLQELTRKLEQVGGLLQQQRKAKLYQERHSKYNTLKCEHDTLQKNQRELMLHVMRLENENHLLRNQFEKVMARAGAEVEAQKIAIAHQRNQLVAQVQLLRTDNQQLVEQLDRRCGQASEQAGGLQRAKREVQQAKEQSQKLAKDKSDLQNQITRMKIFIETRIMGGFEGQRLAMENRFRQEMSQMQSRLRASEQQVVELERGQESILIQFQSKIEQIKGHWREQQSKYAEVLQKVERARDEAEDDRRRMEEVKEELEDRLKEVNHMLKKERAKFVEELQNQYSQKETVVSRLYMVEEELKQVLAQNRLLRGGKHLGSSIRHTDGYLSQEESLQ